VQPDQAIKGPTSVGYEVHCSLAASRPLDGGRSGWAVLCRGGLNLEVV
jgi:hypothetical protein